MKKITAQSILNEYNISIESFRELLNDNNFNADVNAESVINSNVFDKIKKRLHAYKYKTMLDSDKDINKTTTKYIADNKGATVAYGGDENATEIYNDVASNDTVAYNSNTTSVSDETKTGSHNLGEGDVVLLKETKYTILSIISEGTGEAVIYKVTEAFKAVFVLKLYFEFSNKKHEPNAETLERIKNINHKNILKLIDYGVGFEKYQETYCFEISEFAEGGDLLNVIDFKKIYTANFIEYNVIPNIFEGIKHLHLHKIFHCDLKPGNIFYLEKGQKNLIIGDYGSAKAYDIEETKEVIKTSTVKGSNFYLAPEQSRGLVSEKNDYYSFGMILLHLLYPEKFTVSGNFRKIDNTLFEQIVERGDSSMKLIDYDVNYAHINQLIEGLTLNVRKNRWGEKEVEKWIKNEDDDLEINYLNKTNGLNLRLKNNIVVNSENHLIAFIEKHNYWQIPKEKEDELWYNQIFNDGSTLSELQRYLDFEYSRDFRDNFTKIIKITEQNINAPVNYEIRQREEIDYSKYTLIRLLLPEYQIHIADDKVICLEEDSVNEKVNELIDELDQEWQTLSLDKIRFILFQVEFSLKQLLKKSKGQVSIDLQSLITTIYKSLAVSSAELKDFKSEVVKAIDTSEIEVSQAKILNLFHSFKENRDFRYQADHCETIEQLALYIIENESEFENTHFTAEKNWFLKKEGKSELLTLESKELVFEILKDKTESKIELVNLNFNKNRVYDINYKYYKTLTSYLRANNISKEYTLRSNNNETFNLKRKLFDTFSSVAKKFIKETKAKHKISFISKSNENNIRKKVIRSSLKTYAKIYQLQIIAFILLLIVIFLIKIGVLNIEKKTINLGVVTKENSLKTAIVNHKGFITANPSGNVRSEPSPKTKILTSLNSGEDLSIIEKENAPRWYKIKYRGTNYGYVSNFIDGSDLVPEKLKSMNNTKNKIILFQTFNFGEFNFKNINQFENNLSSSINSSKRIEFSRFNGNQTEKMIFTPLEVSKATQLLKYLTQDNRLVIKIVGPTSSDGSIKNNANGALLFANKFKKALVKNEVQRNQISTVSHGEKTPLYDNSKISDWKRNNSLNIKVVSKSNNSNC
ncbi:protein kinase domain-containing protein [Polaribacter sp.]|jgi:serine/threonine protein kinase|uniref:protein kinase domain-containing protein n=1 Tax=Polaribacter sp. TaxID=1920175 RepID=UPI003AE37C4E